MTRRLVLIAASAPRYCLLCLGNQRAVQLVGPGGIGLRITCPHCTPGGPANSGQPLPILSVPFRADTPVRSTP